MPQTQESRADLRASIVKARRTLNIPGNFGAQVIALSLKMIATQFGRDEANRAIRELGLKKHGWDEAPA